MIFFKTFTHGFEFHININKKKFTNLQILKFFLKKLKKLNKKKRSIQT